MSPSSSLGALIQVESDANVSSLTSPPSALRRDEYAGARTPSAYELELLSTGRKHAVGSVASSARPGFQLPPSGPQTPAADEDDLEMMGTTATMTTEAHAVEIMPSLSNPPMNRWRYVGTCGCYFAYGFNDAATGALLPYMEAQYGISYGIVSLIFVANALGFILAPFYTNKVERRLGRAYHRGLANLLMVVGYAIIVATPPFPLVCIAFFLIGSGVAMAMPSSNVFVCNLVNATTLLGMLHGTYGVGGILAPLVATAMVESGIRWSRFYVVCMAISSINTVVGWWTNRGGSDDKPRTLLAALERTQRQQRQPVSSATTDGLLSAPSTQPATGTQTPAPLEPVPRVTKQSSLRRTLSRTTILGALFIFAYQGGEVAISGWVLSFLLAYRAPPFATASPPTRTSGYDPLAPSTGAGNRSLGYVTSGFWGGLTLSRLFVTDKLAQWFGEIWAIAGLTLLSAGFQLFVWLVPNLIAESVAIAVLGFLLGSVYPLATVVFTRYLDRGAQVSSLAVVTALGSSGGALAPFVVGVVSQGAGIWVLHPICLALYAAMGACWYGVNRGRTKRSE